MVRDIFQKSLEQLARRKPFRPFTVELVSGTRFQVDHPEALVFRGGGAVFVSSDGTPWIFDHEGVSGFVAPEDNHAASA